MPIYVYKGNSQVSANAIRNNKVVKAIYAKEQGQDAVLVWGDDVAYSLFTYTIQNNVVTITGLNPNYQFSGNLLIPSKIKGKPVTNIGNSAFNGHASLTSVAIPDSVTSIGGRAFYSCSGLLSITIPHGVTSIGAQSFKDCSGLTTVNWNATECTSVGSYSYPLLFENCSNITTVNIGDNVKIIPSYAFSYCKGITSITIPNSVTSIGKSAFYECTGLTSITIPDSVTSIGETAFEYCNRITSVKIGNGVTNIGRDAFYKCNTQDIYITDIAAWCNISGLDNLMEYGAGNKNLYINNELVTTLVIPNGITTIPNYAFYWFSGLTSVIIPVSVTSINFSAFRECRGLTSITFNGTKTQWNAITKGNSWNYNTGNYTIHCTDGDIPKQ